MNQANYQRLNLYSVDKKYIRDLHRADDKVPSVSPQIHKERRPFVGIVVICQNQKYVIPLSHPEPKHYRMKPSADFDKIFDKKGKLLAVLNFNLMIPVEEAQLTPINLKISKYDSVKEKSYKYLCINEITYCRSPSFSKIISDKANTLYDLRTKESGYKGKSRCLNFKKLEEVCSRYNQKLIKKSTASPPPYILLSFPPF